MFVWSCTTHGELGQFETEEGAKKALCTPCLEVERQLAQAQAAAEAKTNNLSPVQELEHISRALEDATEMVRQRHEFTKEGERAATPKEDPPKKATKKKK